VTPESMERYKVRPACLRDASYVVANMRPEDVQEVLCQLPEGMKRHEIAYMLIMSGDAFVAYDDADLPVLLFGTQPLNMVALNAWAVGTKRTWRVLHRATRWLITEYLPAKAEAGFVTMEARTHVDHHHSHRWLESTGAVVHGPPFVYGRDGQKFLMYRWHASALPAAAERYRCTDAAQ